MTAAHYKGGHHPGNDLGLHYTTLPPIVASYPYSDQLLVTRKFWSPGANRSSQAREAAAEWRRPPAEKQPAGRHAIRERGASHHLTADFVGNSEASSPTRSAALRYWNMARQRYC